MARRRAQHPALAATLSVVLLAQSLPAHARPVVGELLKAVDVDWTTGDGSQGVAWSPIFADYNSATAEDGMIARVADFDETTPNAERGYQFAVSNRADDAFFGLKGLVTGLPKNTVLRFEFDIDIASKYGPDCFGIGGAPGKSVWLKAGATSSEPYTLHDSATDTWRLAAGADKGEQANGGPAGSVVGDVAVEGGGCGDEGAPFAVKSFAKHVHPNLSYRRVVNGAPVFIRSSPRGEVWLLVGFESGYEGASVLFLRRVAARIYRAA